MTEFEPHEIQKLAGAAKQQLRRRMRALRAALPAEARALRSAAIVQRALTLDAFRHAGSIALFFPLLDKYEVDLRALDAEARALGKRVYYPCLEQRGERLWTGFKLTRSIDELELRGGRFAEPPPGAPVGARGDVELLFVPALAVAPSGHRLGYGGGYFDATLPDFCPPALSVAVAFDFQLLAELPALPHDVACGAVLTDARWMQASRSHTP
jgi:5-formyltetrahydrofolate cyclo-ligase